jgi:hypothetical protein
MSGTFVFATAVLAAGAVLLTTGLLSGILTPAAIVFGAGVGFTVLCFNGAMLGAAEVTLAVGAGVLDAAFVAAPFVGAGVVFIGTFTLSCTAFVLGAFKFLTSAVFGCADAFTFEAGSFAVDVSLSLRDLPLSPATAIGLGTFSFNGSFACAVLSI